MVKLKKFGINVIRFVVPFITCCMLLIASVIPSRATTYTALDYPYTKWQSPVTGYLSLNMQNNSGLNSDFETIDFIYPLNPINNIGTVESGYVDDDIVDDIYYSVTTSTGNSFTALNEERERVTLSLSFIETDFPINYMHWQFNDFATNWYHEMVCNMFTITGLGTYSVHFTLNFINDAGELIWYKYDGGLQTVGDATTGERQQRSVLLWDDVEYITETTDIYHGQYIGICDMYVLYMPLDYADNKRNVTISYFATPQGAEEWPNYNWSYSLWLYSQDVGGSGDYEPPTSDVPDSDEWTQFFTDIVFGFFNVPIFGEFTLGHLLEVIVGICVVLWILKFFAGG